MKDGSWSPVQVMGHRSTRSREIDSIDDSGTERLAVDAKITGVAEINLDETSDEVAVYGGVNGSETADAATRQIINVDGSGRVRTDLALLNGTAPSLDGGRLQTNATLQVADADASTANPIPARLSDGTDTALITAAGELNVLASAQPGTDIGDVTVNNAGGASAVNVQDGGNSLTVDNAILSVVGGGTEATAQRVTIASDSTGVLSVDDNGGSLTVDAADLDIRNLSSGQDSVAALQATASNLNAQVVGDVAHDGADSGNPLKMGAKAIAHGASPTAVAANDRTDLYASRHGIPWVIGGHPNVVSTEYRWDTAPTNVDVLGAVAAGEKAVVTQITLTIDEATTVGVKARVGFGATSVPAEPADQVSVNGMILSHSGAIPGGGVVRGDGSGMLGVGGDGEELRITAEAPTSGSARLTVSWYKVPS